MSVRNLWKKIEDQASKKDPELSFDGDGMALLDGEPVFPFKLRPYQKRDFKKFGSMEHPKFFLHYPRRAGKDSFCWMLCVTQALKVAGNYAYILPDREQAGRVIWRGAMIDKFTKKANKFIDMIPSNMIAKKNDQLKTVELTNGSVIYLVGANRPNSLRGINLSGVILSEFAFFPTDEAYLIILPVIAESKGWILINTTPNGFNFSWSLFQRLKHDDEWHAVLETVDTLVDDDGERYVSDDDVQGAVRDGNMPQGLVRQEFYCEPILNEDELYFASEMTQMREDDRIKDAKPDHKLPIHFAMDLGADGTPIIGFQVHWSGDISIVWYQKPFKKVRTWGEYWQDIREYTIKNRLVMGKLVLPHDSAKRAIGESTITSAETDFLNMGADVVKLRRVGNKDSLINLAKVYLPKVVIDESCEHLIDALSSYNRDFDKKLQVFKDKPRHDEWSHPSDAFQYMCQAIEDGDLVMSSKQIGVYYND